MNESLDLNSTRRYTCFACGETSDTYYEYRDHILKEHEEGQDYIKCPLVRCQAPIRDLKAHFKAKHPQEPVPKKGQMRALIWRDQKAPSSRKKKPTFHKGYLTSKKNGGKEMHYRSGWERDVYICLENLSEITSYKVESFPVEYYYKGKSRRYFPDLLVKFNDGRTEVWEIKPDNQKSLEMNKAKWLACEGHCHARSWNFRVVDENDIRGLKQKVRKEVNLLMDHNEIPKEFYTD